MKILKSIIQWITATKIGTYSFSADKEQLRSIIGRITPARGSYGAFGIKSGEVVCRLTDNRAFLFINSPYRRFLALGGQGSANLIIDLNEKKEILFAPRLIAIGLNIWAIIIFSVPTLIFLINWAFHPLLENFFRFVFMSGFVIFFIFWLRLKSKRILKVCIEDLKKITDLLRKEGIFLNWG